MGDQQQPVYVISEEQRDTFGRLAETIGKPWALHFVEISLSPLFSDCRRDLE